MLVPVTTGHLVRVVQRQVWTLSCVSLWDSDTGDEQYMMGAETEGNLNNLASVQLIKCNYLISTAVMTQPVVLKDLFMFIRL